MRQRGSGGWRERRAARLESRGTALRENLAVQQRVSEIRKGENDPNKKYLSYYERQDRGEPVRTYKEYDPVVVEKREGGGFIRREYDTYTVRKGEGYEQVNPYIKREAFYDAQGRLVEEKTYMRQKSGDDGAETVFHRTGKKYEGGQLVWEFSRGRYGRFYHEKDYKSGTRKDQYDADAKSPLAMEIEERNIAKAGGFTREEWAQMNPSAQKAVRAEFARGSLSTTAQRTDRARVRPAAMRTAEVYVGRDAQGRPLTSYQRVRAGGALVSAGGKTYATTLGAGGKPSRFAFEKGMAASIQSNTAAAAALEAQGFSTAGQLSRADLQVDVGGGAVSFFKQPTPPPPSRDYLGASLTRSQIENVSGAARPSTRQATQWYEQPYSTVSLTGEKLLFQEVKTKTTYNSQLLNIPTVSQARLLGFQGAGTISLTSNEPVYTRTQSAAIAATGWVGSKISAIESGVKSTKYGYNFSTNLSNIAARHRAHADAFNQRANEAAPTGRLYKIYKREGKAERLPFGLVFEELKAPFSREALPNQGSVLSRVRARATGETDSYYYVRDKISVKSRFYGALSTGLYTVASAEEMIANRPLTGVGASIAAGALLYYSRGKIKSAAPAASAPLLRRVGYKALVAAYTGAEIGLGTMYAKSKVTAYKTATTRSARGKVLGETGVELAGFAVGGGLAKAAATPLTVRAGRVGFTSQLLLRPKGRPMFDVGYTRGGGRPTSGLWSGAYSARAGRPLFRFSVYEGSNYAPRMKNVTPPSARTGFAYARYRAGRFARNVATAPLAIMGVTGARGGGARVPKAKEGFKFRRQPKTRARKILDGGSGIIGRGKGVSASFFDGKVQARYRSTGLKESFVKERRITVDLASGQRSVADVGLRTDLPSLKAYGTAPKKIRYTRSQARAGIGKPAQGNIVLSPSKGGRSFTIKPPETILKSLENKGSQNLPVTVQKAIVGQQPILSLKRSLTVSKSQMVDSRPWLPQGKVRGKQFYLLDDQAAVAPQNWRSQPRVATGGFRSGQRSKIFGRLYAAREQIRANRLPSLAPSREIATFRRVQLPSRERLAFGQSRLSRVARGESRVLTGEKLSTGLTTRQAARSRLMIGTRAAQRSRTGVALLPRLEAITGSTTATMLATTTLPVGKPLKPSARFKPPSRPRMPSITYKPRSPVKKITTYFEPRKPTGGGGGGGLPPQYPPEEPPPPPIFPWLPKGSRLDRGRRAWDLGKGRKYGYSASLEAIEFGITGKAKTPSGGFTGFEIRPLAVRRRRKK